MTVVEEAPKRTSKPYDNIKQLVEFFLPAFGALYYGLSVIWNLPGGEKVIGSLAVITTFLGGYLKYSRKQYYDNELNFDGQMVVTDTPTGGKAFSLELDVDPLDLEQKKKVEFKVTKPEGMNGTA